jgi:anti-sigma factor RsiW
MSTGHDEMNCIAAREQFAMLLYGELSFDEEEQVEAHLDGCAECRAVLSQEKAVSASFDAFEIQPPPSLLRSCREELHARLMDEEATPAVTHGSWWAQFTDMLTRRPAWAVLRPMGALTLVALGFLGARLMPGAFFWTGGGRGDLQSMGLVEPQASRVRYVEPGSDGRVQIVLDETRQRVVSGRLDDLKIRALLMTAAKDPSDPGLRAETVDILNTRAQSADVRDLLIYEMKNDKKAGVRLKAMEGLKAFAQEGAVRAALSQVLLTDANPGLRTQAIDLLTGGTNTSGDRQMVSTLQELMQRGEQQDYVRERCRQVLEAMNASAETY